MATKKPAHGGKRPGAGKPKGPAKRLVSARLLIPIYEALQARAEERGVTVSREVEEILEAALTNT